MTPLVATRNRTTIARPLKVLVPLIKDELAKGDAAGLEHYRQAGNMLLEAKDQIAYGAWGNWLAKNFELSAKTANRYMRFARLDETEESTSVSGDRSGGLREAIGEKSYRSHAAWDPVFKAADRVNVDHVKQEQQSRDEEVALRRKLATELINLGFKALATRLHPDRGGSRDAMARLNDIRAELIHVASTRRFI
jgi:Protein of unknown function (DUF3102)